MEIVSVSKYEEYISRYPIIYNSQQNNFDDDFKLGTVEEESSVGTIYGIFELRRLSKHDAYNRKNVFDDDYIPRYKRENFHTRYHKIKNVGCLYCYFLKNDTEDSIDLLSSAGIDTILRTDEDYCFFLKDITRPMYGRFSADGTICTMLAPKDNGWNYQVDGGEIKYSETVGHVSFRLLEYIADKPSGEF